MSVIEYSRGIDTSEFFPAALLLVIFVLENSHFIIVVSAYMSNQYYSNRSCDLFVTK